MSAFLGLIEGFYGRPWSWPERDRMLQFASRHGFSFYLYAPKNDPLHRSRWREPYLREEVARFAALRRRCAHAGVELCLGLSPLGFAHEERSDRDLLWAKLEPFLAAGFTSFGILLDDMPQSAAADQAALVNATWEHLRARGATRLTFTPTEYHGTGTSAYLAELGGRLDRGIDVFWTGPEVCSRVLTRAHVEAVSATIRRPVLLWDNYPVNDLDMRFDPHIRPLRGREPALLDAAGGLASAAGPAPELSKIALATVAAWFREREDYSAERAWGPALAEVAGDAEDARALARLGDLTRSVIEEPSENAFAGVEQRFWEWYSEGDWTTADATMTAELERLAEAGERLLGLRNRALRREVRPWALKLLAWVGVAEESVALLRATPHEAPRPTTAAARRRLVELLRRARDNFHAVAGDSVDQFARRCLAAAQE